MPVTPAATAGSPKEARNSENGTPVAFRTVFVMPGIASPFRTVRPPSAETVKPENSAPDKNGRATQNTLLSVTVRRY